MSEVVTNSSSAAQAAEVPYPAPAIGWYATGMLAFLYWLSLLDRQIIALLVDPIKQDLGLTDVQLGMLQGVAFAVAFTIFGLVFGALADRMSRRWVIYIGVSVWSLGTMMCGAAMNFWHLLLARVGVGAGEAALNPCATSMIADLFPRHKLTTAMAVYSMGATVGTGTALIVGGMIVHMATNLGDVFLPVVGRIAPWQMVFFIVGVPGMLLAFTIFTVPEPVRRGPRLADQPRRAWYGSYLDLFRFIASRARFFACHYIGFTLLASVVTGLNAWYVAHMTRSFGWTVGRASLVLGLTLMAAGVLGKILCGQIVDAMYRRGYRDAQFRWMVGCVLVSIPLGLIGTTSENPWVFLILMGVFVTLLGGMPACAMASLNLITPNQLRGTGVAVYATIGSLIGGSSGPFAVAAVSQYVFHGDSAHSTLGLGMAVLIGVCCPLAAVVLWLGLRSMREAMATVEQPQG